MILRVREVEEEEKMVRKIQAMVFKTVSEAFQEDREKVQFEIFLL